MKRIFESKKLRFILFAVSTSLISIFISFGAIILAFFLANIESSYIAESTGEINSYQGSKGEIVTSLKKISTLYEEQAAIIKEESPLDQHQAMIEIFKKQAALIQGVSTDRITNDEAFNILSGYYKKQAELFGTSQDSENPQIKKLQYYSTELTRVINESREDYAAIKMELKGESPTFMQRQRIDPAKHMLQMSALYQEEANIIGNIAADKLTKLGVPEAKIVMNRSNRILNIIKTGEMAPDAEYFQLEKDLQKLETSGVILFNTLVPAYETSVPGLAAAVFSLPFATGEFLLEYARFWGYLNHSLETGTDIPPEVIARLEAKKDKLIGKHLVYQIFWKNNEDKINKFLENSTGLTITNMANQNKNDINLKLENIESRLTLALKDIQKVKSNDPNINMLLSTQEEVIKSQIGTVSVLQKAALQGQVNDETVKKIEKSSEGLLNSVNTLKLQTN